MTITITESVKWIGKIDWELRKFHGDEYSTGRGSTYNSYLVRDEKTALIDSVWHPFSDDFLENLSREIDLEKIDYIIVNHAEPDHSGSLPAVMKILPDRPIYCTANAVKSLTGHYHQDWNFNVVKTGDRLSLGSRELVFIAAPMLHWPDSMFSYLTGNNVLFSNDAFGQHLASEGMFNDTVDRCELYQECLKYYANILTPFNGLVKKKIEEFVGLGLPLDVICTSHGVIWREDPLQIVKQYAAWADDFQEDQITIIYDTMWESTRKMAEAIASGIKSVDDSVTVKVLNSAKRDKNDIITEVFRSKAVLVGSPTINKGILFSVAGILEMMLGLKFKGKKAAAFGSYGWSGESIRIINERLQEAGFEIVGEGIRGLWKPDNKSLEDCHDFGKTFAQACPFPRKEA